MADLYKQRRALKRAIAVIELWHEKVPLAYDGELPADAKVLREILANVGQMAFPEFHAAEHGEDAS